VRGFQSNLLSLVQDIRELSPNTQVVFPALPTYRLDPDSILNVFPLTTFLDRLMGFWDAQKMHAAEKCPNIVQYVGLNSDTVNEWYKAANGGSLLAADGIHPNAKCYDQWATHLGNVLADRNEATQQFATLPTGDESVAMSFC
jgi:lysophospholipase L1-like esterase